MAKDTDDPLRIPLTEAAELRVEPEPFIAPFKRGDLSIEPPAGASRAS